MAWLLTCVSRVAAVDRQTECIEHFIPRLGFGYGTPELSIRPSAFTAEMRCVESKPDGITANDPDRAR
jgi:hypothetical protein